MSAGTTARGAILHYLDITQHLQTSHITHFGEAIEEERFVWLDKFTIAI